MTRSSPDLMAEFFPDVEFRAPVEGTQSLINIDKARHLLGWEPTHSWRNEGSGKSQVSRLGVGIVGAGTVTQEVVPRPRRRSPGRLHLVMRLRPVVRWTGETTQRHMEDLLEHLVRWHLHPETVVTHRLRLDQADQAHQSPTKEPRARSASCWIEQMATVGHAARLTQLLVINWTGRTKCP
jgi:hypothetical protein